jgi:putative spermidine/putrescine transport system permease protein
MRKMRLGYLAAPLVVFNLLFFVLPIGSIIFYAVYSPDFVKAFPETSRLLNEWDQQSLPDEGVFQAFAEELDKAKQDRTLASAARRLNYEISGYRSLLTSTAAAAKDLHPPYKDAMIAADARWAELNYWQVAASASHRYTALYVLAAFDLKKAPDGSIHYAPEGERVYLATLLRTFWMSFVVTAACIVLSYPIAFLIAGASPFASRVLLALVMIPFWMSLLVRTAAWMVLLQKNGLVNELLSWLGLIGEPLQLIFNRTGVYLALVHIMLPFAILPIYSVMRSISKDHLRAAASLGARPTLAFIEVYVPQTLPGVAAGALLVFVLSIGFYITPALLGGPKDQMISYIIAQFAGQNANWGMAGALALLLIFSVVCVTSAASLLTRTSRKNSQG